MEAFSIIGLTPSPIWTKLWKIFNCSMVSKNGFFKFHNFLNEDFPYCLFSFILIYYTYFNLCFLNFINDIDEEDQCDWKWC